MIIIGRSNHLLHRHKILLLALAPLHFSSNNRGTTFCQPMTTPYSTSVGRVGATGGPSTPNNRDYYRHDGVRITHDPYAPGMAEKYGTPGHTDNEGFDPYADSVGPGIYGGIVTRDDDGNVVIGFQYQNHNPRPGPVYAGGGYSPSTLMLDDTMKMATLLEKYPDLVNDITTGGAQPLHMCGMSKNKQFAVRYLVEHGADIEALDTYGMTPLHRMASNNLADGAKMLLEAGADVFNNGKCGRSPLQVARGSAAGAVMVINRLGSSSSSSSSSGSKSNVIQLTVTDSIQSDVNGNYYPQSPSNIPKGFTKVCCAMNWDTQSMWTKLNGIDPNANIWFAHSENDSYIYYNKGDGKWWIDGPNGEGVWIIDGPSHAPPAHGWSHVTKQMMNGKRPMVRTFRKMTENGVK